MQPPCKPQEEVIGQRNNERCLERTNEHALQGCPVLIAPFTGSASAGGGGGRAGGSGGGRATAVWAGLAESGATFGWEGEFREG